MARQVSREIRLERLVQKCRQRIDALPDHPKSLSHAPDSKLYVLLREAGYAKISPKFLARFDAELRQAGVGTFPDLTDPTIERGTRIFLFDRDNPIPGLQPPRVLFNTEVDLETFLVNNFKAMSFFRTRGLRLRRRQYQISAGCVIDMLAENSRTGELVGIELKAQEPDERLLAQVNKYAAALAALAEKEGRPGARLLILTGQPDTQLRTGVAAHGERHGVPVEWLLYQLNVRISESSG